MQCRKLGLVQICRDCDHEKLPESQDFQANLRNFVCKWGDDIIMLFLVTENGKGIPKIWKTPLASEIQLQIAQQLLNQIKKYFGNN